VSEMLDVLGRAPEAIAEPNRHEGFMGIEVIEDHKGIFKRLMAELEKYHLKYCHLTSVRTRLTPGGWSGSKGL